MEHVHGFRRIRIPPGGVNQRRWPHPGKWWWIRGSNCNQCGSGGRIAIVTAANTLELPISNVSVQGGSVYNYQAGSGTIFVKTGSSVHGTLYMKFTNVYGAYAYRPSYKFTTPIPTSQVWTFDNIVFSGKAILRVPTGTKLVLPNGLGSVSGNDYEGGIILDGGELCVPSTGTRCEGSWTLMPHADAVVSRGLTLAGPRFGNLNLRRIEGDFAPVTVSVKGPVVLEGASSIDLYGNAYTTGKITQGNAKLTNGNYTAETANAKGVAGIGDSSTGKAGALRIKAGGIMVILR